jgi:fluoroquinolone resistance protein
MEQIFTDAQFDNIDHPLEKGEYEQCRFTRCDLPAAELSGIVFIDCVFERCNLSMADTARTTFRDVLFKDCKLWGIHFEKCSEYGLAFRFEGCSLNHSSFFGTKLPKMSFWDSQLREVDFTDCDLKDAVFDKCDLTDATFENTNLEKVDFRSAEHYSINPERNKLKRAKFSLTGLPGLLTKYDIDIY